MASLYSYDLTNEEIVKAKPFRWMKFCLDYDLYSKRTKQIDKITVKWKSLKFDKSNKPKVPAKQGIYMFVLDIQGSFHLNSTCKYVLYVGQTDNLQTRFDTYFGYEMTDEPSDFLKKCMVLIWKGKLDFHFFETGKLSAQKLTCAEFDLIDTIVPPINQRFRGRILKKAIKLYAPR